MNNENESTFKKSKVSEFLNLYAKVVEKNEKITLQQKIACAITCAELPSGIIEKIISRIQFGELLIIGTRYKPRIWAGTKWEDPMIAYTIGHLAHAGIPAPTIYSIFCRSRVHIVKIKLDFPAHKNFEQVSIEAEHTPDFEKLN